VLESIFKSHKGKNSLNFVVYDNDEKIKLNLPSQKVKVNITQELINVLEEQSLVYKLN
jgi:DNA polymerase-3 subunit alpha